MASNNTKDGNNNVVGGLGGGEGLEKPKKDDEQSNKDSKQIKLAQAATGIVIACFTSAHLLNHFAMHFGLDAHRALFFKFRKVYTSPPVESVLLGSIAVHSLLGLYQYKGVSTSWSKFLFQASGWYLLMVMPIHVTATRYLVPQMQEYDVTAAAMAARYLPSVFIPYYSLLAASGAIHMLGGLSKAGTILRVRLLQKIPSRGKLFYFWSALLGAAAISSALAVMGVYFRFEMREEALLRKDILAHWPSWLVRMIHFPTENSWFATLKLN